jgi:hypothetical protein
LFVAHNSSFIIPPYVERGGKYLRAKPPVTRGGRVGRDEKREGDKGGGVDKEVDKINYL